VSLRGRACLALAILATVLLAVGEAAADPLRILVAASHVRGRDGEEVLRHSTEDADQVRDVLASPGGFAPGATFRVVDPTAAALRDALDRARALATTHSPADVTFVLYFSGRGDREGLRLAGESIAMSEISDRVQAIPAALRVLVTDACRTEAPVVPTQTFGPSTKVELPPEADAHYLVYAVGSRSVLGEIWSSPERRAVFALPPGEYIVQRRTGSGASAVADVAIGAGQDRLLAAADFRAMPEEELAGKGGRVLLRPNEVGVSLGAGLGRLTDVAGIARLTFARSFGSWALAAGVHGSEGVQRTTSNDVTVTTGGVETSAELRWPFGRTLAAVGIGAAADLVHQRVQRTDMAFASPTFSTTADFTGFAAGPIAFARLRERLGASLWMEVALRGEGLLAQFDGTLGGVWSLSAGLGAGACF
jgi:hypothetical protein